MLRESAEIQKKVVKYGLLKTCFTQVCLKLAGTNSEFFAKVYTYQVYLKCYKFL